MNLNKQWIAIILLGVLVMGLEISGPQNIFGNARDADEGFGKGGDYEQIITISPVDFQAQLGVNYTKDPGEIRLAGNTQDDLYAGINLPDGATLTAVIVYGSATAGNDDFDLYDISLDESSSYFDARIYSKPDEVKGNETETFKVRHTKMRAK